MAKEKGTDEAINVYLFAIQDALIFENKKIKKCFVVSYSGMKNYNFCKNTIIRVGSHVVSVRIHCTEKWRTSFHNDVLSKSK